MATRSNQVQTMLEDVWFQLPARISNLENLDEDYEIFPQADLPKS